MTFSRALYLVEDKMKEILGTQQDLNQLISWLRGTSSTAVQEQITFTTLQKHLSYLSTTLPLDGLDQLLNFAPSF